VSSLTVVFWVDPEIFLEDNNDTLCMHAWINKQYLMDETIVKKKRPKCFLNFVIFHYGVLGRSRNPPEDDSNRLYMHAWMNKQYLMGEIIVKETDSNASKTVSSLTIVFWGRSRNLPEHENSDRLCMHVWINNTWWVKKEKMYLVSIRRARSTGSFLHKLTIRKVEVWWTTRTQCPWKEGFIWNNRVDKMFSLRLRLRLINLFELWDLCDHWVFARHSVLLMMFSDDNCSSEFSSVSRHSYITTKCDIFVCQKYPHLFSPRYHKCLQFVCPG